MKIAAKYNPVDIEDKWYKEWIEKGFFGSVPDEREPYTIVIPPPNVTGVLHMGHMLNNTIQDILIRKARMEGKNACWVPGTDHASIATEAKVVNMLKERGINKSDLSRDEFLKYAWEWKEKHGGIILEQLKKLGASCDWDRTRFTMEDDLSEAVIDVFIDLYNKGLIYRGHRMVNWDPKALTALSDEEVNHKEVKSNLYYIRYKIKPTPGNSEEYLTVATTRPETIMADTAICVNPNDERYKHLQGKTAYIPLIDREIPIIADEYVDIEFGTGCLKVTPAHDENDYNLGKKHNLPFIDMFNANGTLNANAKLYIGEDRFIARKKIAKELQENGALVKTEEIVNKVGYSERTDEVIEPRLSLQWFCKMDKMAAPAIENVNNNNIKFYPEKFKNTYRHWMENIRDWCISRQLWWGQRIPAWYLPDGSFVVAKTLEEAFGKFEIRNSKFKIEDIKQDEDVLDTWFSSWLWPISVFDGFKDPNNADIKYYYPTNTLVTAPEILFFWVARMIMAGYEYRGEKPFEHVYLTGIVRDKQGRKMSKSLGNSPDPIELINKYGADGVRMGMLLTSPAGNDLPFDEGLCEQGRNFCNKIWNAFRLLKGWEIDKSLKQPEYAEIGVKWFDAKFNDSLTLIEDHFSKFRLSEALMTAYKLVWDDFCSWYLEIIKPAYQQPIDEKTFNATVNYFEKIVKILHPFMPFITEELWHELKDRKDNDFIIVAPWAKFEKADQTILNEFKKAEEVIVGIRNFRKSKQVPNKDQAALFVKADSIPLLPLVSKLGNLSSTENVKDKISGAYTFIANGIEYYIPLEGRIDIAGETEKIEQELEYTRGFLKSVMSKLSNERFVNNAPPAVLETERKKQADAEAKIKMLEEQLASFAKS